MFYPNELDDYNQRNQVNAWYGYNHTDEVVNGQFYDCMNTSTDHFPLLSPREERVALIEVENIRGLMQSDGELCYLDGNVLQYRNKSWDITDYSTDPEDEISEQKLIRMGAYALIFPAAVYVNLVTDEIGSIAAETAVPAGKTITYTMSDMNGAAIGNVVTSDQAPENPTNGQYWMSTADNAKGLYIWYQALGTWQAVATSYVKIHLPDTDLSDFAVGDAFYMDSVKLKDFNNGSIIRAMGSDYLVINGRIPEGTVTETTDAYWTLRIRRKIPQLDHICVSGNRVWGCHYGEEEDGTVTNEIYCSKLGDFKNWYVYDGIQTDSWAVSIGEDGPFTGAVAYQGYPTFFKENYIIRVFGSMPSEYGLSIDNARGVQEGSHRSIAILDEVLIYKSADAVVAYDGSRPVSISKDLGRDAHFYEAVGCACVGKYYISMQTSLGKYKLFVWDMEKNIWHREDDTRFLFYTASENGQAYGATKSRIYGIGANKDNAMYINRLVDEEYVQWYAETGDMGYELPDMKYVSRITVRAYIPYRSELKVEISHDDGQFHPVATLRGNSNTRTNSILVKPYRCDHFRLRFSGHGDVRIRNLTMTMESGSEEREWIK